MSSHISWMPKQNHVFFYLWWNTVEMKKIVCNIKKVLQRPLIFRALKQHAEGCLLHAANRFIIHSE